MGAACHLVVRAVVGPAGTRGHPAGFMSAVSTSAISFYWRPGCGFCMRLGRALDRLGVPVVRRNIWDEPQAAAFVRSVADGSETVPTVVVGEHSMVNPSLDQVVAALHQHAPELVPDRPPEPDGLLTRIFGG